jgi:hypothetical protein
MNEIGIFKMKESEENNTMYQGEQNDDGQKYRSDLFRFEQYFHHGRQGVAPATRYLKLNRHAAGMRIMPGCMTGVGFAVSIFTLLNPCFL